LAPGRGTAPFPYGKGLSQYTGHHHPGKILGKLRRGLVVKALVEFQKGSKLLATSGTSLQMCSNFLPQDRMDGSG